LRLWKYTQHNKRPGLVPAIAASTVIEESLTDLELMLDYSPSLAHRYAPIAQPNNRIACQASVRSDGQHTILDLTLLIQAVMTAIAWISHRAYRREAIGTEVPKCCLQGAAMNSD
jgi:hypothetical protein